MKRTDAHQQESPRAARSNQPFFGAKSATTFFATGQSGQRDPFFHPSHTSLTTPIQAKLTVGAVGDQYEQEADRVAAEVVDRINSPSVQQTNASQPVQRMGQEEDDLQMKRSPDAIQRMGKEDEELQRAPIAETIQRMGEEEDELQMKPIVQRVGAEGGSVSADLEGEINSARGGGQSLAPDFQTQMGQAMGADFSGVRVHTDGRSDQLNQSIQAKAFTTGQDVFFRQGAYEPRNRSGQELIAHELTHVVQQNQGVHHALKRQNETSIRSGIAQVPSHLAQRDNVIQRVIDANSSNNPFLKDKKLKNVEARENPQENTSDPIEKRYVEIERQIPTTYEDLDTIAQQSTYKHLKKVGKDFDNIYKEEYKAANYDKTQGTLKPKIEKLNEDRENLNNCEDELASLRRSNKASERPNETKTRLEAIKDKVKEIEDLKNKIAAQEAFLRAQKAPVDWQTGKLDENRLKNRKVDYLTELERQDFALHIVDGKLKQKRKGQEKLYDTTTSYTVQQGKGWGIYVMNPNGQFYAGPHTIGRFHHSSFLAGGAVAGAGELKVNQGSLMEINDKSGHYTPGKYQIIQTLTQLKSNNVDLTQVNLTIRNKGHKAGQFLDQNEGILGSNSSSSKSNQSEDKYYTGLKELGLYWMNGEWHTKKIAVKDDLETYKQIVDEGGKQVLEGKGFALDSDGYWQDTSSKKVMRTASDLLKALTGELDSDSDTEELDEDEKYERIVDDLEDELGSKDKIIQFLATEMPGLKWENGQWLMNDEDGVEKTEIGRAIEAVQNAEKA